MRVHPGTKRAAPDRDRGAALPVAIGFMVMIGAMAAGMTTLVTSGVANRIALDEIRDRQYAADGAVERSIAQTRTAITSGTATCGSNWSTSAVLNGVSVRVDTRSDCVALAGADGLPVRQFTGRYAACVDTGVACVPDAVIVQAVIGFPTDGAGAVIGTAVRSWSVG